MEIKPMLMAFQAASVGDVNFYFVGLRKMK